MDSDHHKLFVRIGLVGFGGGFLASLIGWFWPYADDSASKMQLAFGAGTIVLGFGFVVCVLNWLMLPRDVSPAPDSRKPAAQPIITLPGAVEKAPSSSARNAPVISLPSNTAPRSVGTRIGPPPQDTATPQLSALDHSILDLLDQLTRPDSIARPNEIMAKLTPHGERTVWFAVDNLTLILRDQHPHARNHRGETNYQGIRNLISLLRTMKHPFALDVLGAVVELGNESRVAESRELAQKAQSAIDDISKSGAASTATHAAARKGPQTTASSTSVAFRKTQKQQDGRTYDIYAARTRNEAIAFLRTHEVKEERRYAIVETPEGNVGKDFLVIFDEATSAVIEIGVRAPLAQLQLSRSRCCRCGYPVIPLQSANQVRVGSSVVNFVVLSDLKERGGGFACPKCAGLVCAICAGNEIRAEGGRFENPACPICDVKTVHYSEK